MFHVPESARDQTHPIYRSTVADGNNGAFHLVSPEPGWQLAVLASDSEGWEHVSVHAYKRGGRRQRTPTWREMTFIKERFWDDEDVVIQFHPRRSEYVNLHPHTLHLWRPTTYQIPTPPPILVGPLALTT